jgi:signal recognition particle GTPase
MPYKLVKAEGTDKYYVMTTDTGRLHSKEAMTKEMAKRQMGALNVAKKDVVTIPRGKFLAEHRQLIGLMSRVGQEAEQQRREMNNFVR